MRSARKSREAAAGSSIEHRSTSGPRPIEAATQAHASPARELQSSLAARWEAGEPEIIARWPGAVRVGIVCGGSGAFWAVVIVVMRWIAKV